MILKISLRAKAGVPKTFVKRMLQLHSLYFPQNAYVDWVSRGIQWFAFYFFLRLAIDHVPSLGLEVTTANWSTWEVPTSFSVILAVMFQRFAPLGHWKLSVYFIGLQREKQQAINSEFNEKYWVNAIFVRKFDLFPKSVLSSNWSKFPTLSLIIINTVGQIYQN